MAMGHDFMNTRWGNCHPVLMVLNFLWDANAHNNLCF
jgi:hypothetical protein